MGTAVDHNVTSTEPRTLPELLRLLGVNDEPVAKQWEPITAWLAENEASPELWMSLLANGYGLLLEQMVPTFHRPIPHRRITTASGTKETLLI
ncbi:hypothetical protein [Mycobacterium xenopi]|uniref:Uncharacterized protein n=1 Tax=Mycobacterium xenopi TaxID=1789 RepID=A0AAD1H221_MYCXE|nr:hypothetical protein [Mycobacterium xenopi]EID16709.1 hypothetical protein MXEN_03754 [Mycobacterium xenopi RIVM700367]MDA3639364.1 hypothetical protein [Mycobacterium xenopi]MDA3658357.1 hypothetical protein [Mycobacterium xenopi]MDA3662113.1 hypothetical protein [Mycobacterium xenopi]ORX20502.1 hypothetical protein AWC32_05070 [Mycobacterium xenopi]